MTTMNFTELDGQSEPLLWEYVLQEMAVRGVLWRRGGLNFLTFSHTPADIAQVITAATAVFQELRSVWGTSRLADAVAARKLALA